MKTHKILTTATTWKRLLSKLSLCNCWVCLLMTAVTCSARTWCCISLNHKVPLSTHKANKCRMSHSSIKGSSFTFCIPPWENFQNSPPFSFYRRCFCLHRDKWQAPKCVLRYTKTSLQPFQACQDTLVDFSPLIFKGFKFSKPFLSQDE